MINNNLADCNLLNQRGKMSNNKVYDIIINLLIGTKNQNTLTDATCLDEAVMLNGCSYLLNQTIRQYQIPRDHYFVSERALALWEKIRTDSIFDYTYRDKIIKTTDDVVTIDKYRGGEKHPHESTNIYRGDAFTYNDVFTDEHVVTVSNIIEELKSLSTYDYSSVKRILDKIYICKMLKEEDRIIENKRNRSTDYREVIAEDYYNVGIRLVGFDLMATLQDLIYEAEEKLIRLKKNA